MSTPLNPPQPGITDRGGPGAASAAPAAVNEAGSAQLLSIIDSAMDAIVTVDESQRVVMFNKAAERAFGVPASEALGSVLDRFIPERFRAAHPHHVRAFGRTGATTRAMGRLSTLVGLRADGSEFPIEASISHSSAGGRRLFTVILRDVSERQRLEAQLLQAQKMEGIGRLAGGVAHDFNNLLMAVFNYLALASRRLDPGHPAHGALTHAHQAAERAASLTRQLLAFARRQPAAPRVVAPREVAAGLVPMLGRMLGADVRVRAEFSPDTGHARVDPTQLEQVLVNLAVNARDAMPEGGTLTITTGNVVLDAAHCRGHPGAAPGPYVMVCVTDTGTGMPEEVRARLFEPFFTTKPAGKGTGLGLATCHGIVHRAGGHIAVESAPGSGTTMRVYLPRVEEPVPGPAAGAPAPAPTRGTETILLVEDSAMVRHLTGDALRDAGYTVLAAERGSHALALASAHPGRVDLLLTDVVMPEMSGVELARALTREHPEIPVVFMSGYGEETVAGLGVDVASPSFQPKPFLTDELLRRVRALLDQRTGVRGDGHR